MAASKESMAKKTSGQPPKEEASVSRAVFRYEKGPQYKVWFEDDLGHIFKLLKSDKPEDHLEAGSYGFFHVESDNLKNHFEAGERNVSKTAFKYHTGPQYKVWFEDDLGHIFKLLKSDKPEDHLEAGSYGFFRVESNNPENHFEAGSYGSSPAVVFTPALAAQKPPLAQAETLSAAGAMPAVSTAKDVTITYPSASAGSAVSPAKK